MSFGLSIGMNIHRWGSPFFAYDKSHLSDDLDTCNELGIKLIRYNNSFRSENATRDISTVVGEIKKRDMQMMLVIDDQLTRLNYNFDDEKPLKKMLDEYIIKMKDRHSDIPIEVKIEESMHKPGFDRYIVLNKLLDQIWVYYFLILLKLL